MPWTKTPDDRRRDARVYSTPEYRRNRAIARRRANGRCEGCGHRHARLEFDAAVPVSQGGDHSLANGRMLCKGDGTCKCHDRKTAYEGGGYRTGQRTAPDPEPVVRTAW